MATNKDIDDFCRRMHIKDDCTVDGEKIGIRLLIELLNNFAQEQVKNCSIPGVRQQSELLKAFADYYSSDKYNDEMSFDTNIDNFLKAFNCA